MKLGDDEDEVAPRFIGGRILILEAVVGASAIPIALGRFGSAISPRCGGFGDCSSGRILKRSR